MIADDAKGCFVASLLAMTVDVGGLGGRRRQVRKFIITFSFDIKFK